MCSINCSSKKNNRNNDMDLRGTIHFHSHRLMQTMNQCLSTALARLLAWSRGIGVGQGLVCRGVPYFYRTPHSVIQLGRGCSVFSSFRSNNIGSMTRSRLCTQTPHAQLLIGDRVGMSAVTITAHERICIGDDTMIGAGSVITDSDWHCLLPEVEARHQQPGKSRPVVIGCNVFIGTRCLILKGVSIGDHAVIGAGSVVTHDIPANAHAAGNPCKVISQ